MTLKKGALRQNLSPLASPVRTRFRAAATEIVFVCGLLLFCLPVLGQSDPEIFRMTVDRMDSGAYQEAEKLLDTGGQQNPFLLRLRLELALRKGRAEEVQAFSTRLLSLYRLGQLRSGAELSQAALAAWKLDQWEEANQVFIQASQMSPTYRSLYIDWGNLYLEKFNPAEAEGIFRDALSAADADPQTNRWKEEDAWLGLARALADQGKPGVDESLEKIFALNPQHAGGLALKAYLAIQEEDWDQAREHLDQGLKANPEFLPLLETECAYHYFRGRLDDFRTCQSKIGRINPSDDQLYEMLGDLSVTKRRLEESVDFYRRAVAANPSQWSALASLGINLLRLAREEEGKRILEEAYAGDPYNIWTVNTLRLLDSFDRFEVSEISRFKIKLHSKEAAALRPYVHSLVQECLQILERKYQHSIEGGYLLEIYPDHEDFAVRTLGLPGLGALGATFGKVVAMDSPSARPRGKFHWGSTLWHELAHVVTLSLSQNQVPRWFTEGLSMMEERQAREGWGEQISVAFVRAWEEDQLLPIADLNSGFIRPSYPGQIQISYLQAGWLCEFLAKRYGFDRLREMLVAYADQKTTAEVFESVLQVSVDQVNSLFEKEMAQVLEPLSRSLKQPESIDLNSADSKSLKLALAAQPDHYLLNLALSRRLAQSQEPEAAIPYLEKAVELVPWLAGENSPYPLLSEIYRKLDDTESELDWLERWWNTSAANGDAGLRLATLLKDAERKEEALQVARDLMFVDPLSREVHQIAGEVLIETGHPLEAVREYSVLLSLDPVDPAEVHFQLARALHQAGEKERARRQVLKALEIAPGYRAAQGLLLELVQP